jgi:hypothetical protein
MNQSSNFILHFSSLILIMVDLARFERATSTFAESRSHSAELQIPGNFGLRISDCGIEMLPLEKNKIRNPQSAIRDSLAEDYGVEP